MANILPQLWQASAIFSGEKTSSPPQCAQACLIGRSPVTIFIHHIPSAKIFPYYTRCFSVRQPHTTSVNQPFSVILDKNFLKKKQFYSIIIKSHFLRWCFLFLKKNEKIFIFSPPFYAFVLSSAAFCFILFFPDTLRFPTA